MKITLLIEEADERELHKILDGTGIEYLELKRTHMATRLFCTTICLGYVNLEAVLEKLGLITAQKY